MNIITNYKYGYFIFIPILTLVTLILGINTAENYNLLGGGTSIDSYNYFEIAKNLPQISNSIFPFFYPLLLKISNLFFDNYWLTSKALNIALIVFLFYYTYSQKKFWKEYWVILATVGFLENYSWSHSETLFICMLVLLSQNLILYFSKQEKQISKNYFILKFSVILILLISTKYSGLFIILGLILYSSIIYLFKRKLLKPIFISSVIALLYTISYLLLNKYLTGYYTGSRVSMESMKETVNIRYSLTNIIYSLNPLINSRDFFGIKINYIMLIALTCTFLTSLFLISNKKNWRFDFIGSIHFILGLVFILGTLITFLNVKIDNLNPRLCLPFTFLIFVSLFSLLKLNTKTLSIIAFSSLTLHFLNIIYLYSLN